MTIKKSHFMALCSLIMLSCTLLLPARSWAACHDDQVGSGIQIDVESCFNSDLSGYVDSSVMHDGVDDGYVIVGAEAIVYDETAGKQVFSQSAFDVSPWPGGEIDLNFDSSQYSPAPTHGHTYQLTAKACAANSYSDSGTCSGWITAHVYSVTY
jgi:hypothetical protein